MLLLAFDRAGIMAGSMAEVVTEGVDKQTSPVSVREVGLQQAIWLFNSVLDGGDSQSVPGCLYNKGVALEALGRFSEAEATYDLSIVLRPSHFQSWFNRGNVRGRLGRILEANADFLQALELEPALEMELCRKVALGLLALNLPADAVPYFRRANIDPAQYTQPDSSP
jgi:tetratricopeptide (TPR) repeat protein